MKKQRWNAPLLLLCCIIAMQTVFAQDSRINSATFFSDSSLLNVSLVTNMTEVLNSGKKSTYDLKGALKTTLPDGTDVNDQIIVEVRGNFRLKFCYLPPVKLIFNYEKGSTFSSLKTLKLVNVCKVSRDYEQYLLKEFLTYRILNLLTDKSFRVRLLNLNWQDSAGRRKTFSTHAFLIEDIKDVAKRNDCDVWTKSYVSQEATNRKQMTLIALFQYMIGNTDWNVPAKHNIRLIAGKNDDKTRPFAVPYDFDWTGLVDANYAYPDERLGIKYITQRLYRGYPRDLAELNEAFDVFNQQKEKIYSLIYHFDLLTPSTKRGIIKYLDDFYNTINNPKLAKYTFLDNARTH